MADAHQDVLADERRVKRWRTDFPAFAKDVLRIQDKDGRLVPFKLNRAQKHAWSLIKQDIDAGKPVRMYILKARQLGFSTLIQGVLYWIASLNKNRNVLVTAHEDDAAAGLFLKSRVFYGSTPEHLRPMMRLSNRKELHFANPDPKAGASEMGLQSRIVVKTAKNRNLGASMTLHGLHLSEFAKYERVLQDVDIAMATVLQTVPRRPNTFVFLETTADGLGYAHDFWKEKNGYRKVFISWVADETYTIKHRDLTLRRKDLDEADDAKFGNEVVILGHVVSELKKWYPEKADDADWLRTESLCRMQWRRQVIVEQFRENLDLFRQENPITAEEAFLTSGNAVFDQRKISDRIAALEERDEDEQVIGLRFPPTPYRYDREVGDFYRARYGPLNVYEPPDPNAMYVMGADVGEGFSSTSGDYSCAQVLKLPHLLQVATYVDRIDPDDFADVLYRLGEMYGWAFLGVEVNAVGFATVLRLSKGERFYPALYQREILDSATRKYQKKYGWHTNRQTKTELVTGLRVALRDDLILFRDVETLKEMSLYVQHDNGQMGAVKGEHDDRVMALALAYQMALARGVQNPRRIIKETSVAPTAEPPGYSFEWWARLAEKDRRETAVRQRYGLR